MKQTEIRSFDSYNLTEIEGGGYTMTLLSGKADNEHIPVVFVKRHTQEAERTDKVGNGQQ